MALHALMPVMARHVAAPSLQTACGRDPRTACQLVWDVTHNEQLSQLTRTYLAGPVQLILRIAFVVALALVARVFARRLISRITKVGAREGSARSGAGHRGSGGRGRGAQRREYVRREQRAHALGSVLGNAASVTIFTIAGFIVLGDLGLNLAPILASAGVLGIAIGFGAQNLVQDFLAGIFMLLEDQYGVGDVISLKNITGTVEVVSLRITRIRDVNGVVWHIRNGTIGKAGNESHGWARAVVDFPVPYELDTAEVRALMEDTAAQMWQDPAWRDVMTERPEVWGIEELSGDQVVIRVIARTAPLRQWDVSRELRERLKVAVASVSPAAAAAVAAEVLDGPAADVPGEAEAELASEAADPDGADENGAGADDREPAG